MNNKIKKEVFKRLIIIIIGIIIGFLDYKFFTPVWQIVVKRWLFFYFLIALPLDVLSPIIKEKIYKSFLIYWSTVVFFFYATDYFLPQVYHFSTRVIIFLIVMTLLSSIIFCVYVIILKIKEQK
ncbi:MAG: hypothetical protein ABIL90_01950 [candidate division WOR-3 bacterium]